MSIKLKVSAKQIIDLYTINRLSATEVAKNLDIAIATVLKYLRLNDVEIRGAFKVTKPRPSRTIPLDSEQLIYLYTIKHLPSTEIAKQFGVTNPTILRGLRQLGIKINPKHGNPFNKTRIQFNGLSPIIKNPKILKQKLTGEVTCPICGEIRRLTLSRQRINDILKTNGRCNQCAMKARASQIPASTIKALYENKNFSTYEIASKFKVSPHVICNIMRQNNIIIRDKSKTRAKVFKRKINNKGTLDSPVLGDIRNGLEIGLKNKGYYMWVKCEKCNGCRWESKSRVKIHLICKPCAMILNGENHSGENAHMWLGGISFELYTPEFNKRLKEQIRMRDNYTCQLCGAPQNGISLAVHHIDYNKKNNSEYNLISLCPSPSNCHNKTTHNREYWTTYFNEIIKLKYSDANYRRVLPKALAFLPSSTRYLCSF